MTNAKRQGTSYEALFVSEALKRGLDAHEPVGDYLPHDTLVTGHSGQMYRVQVKGTTSQPKGATHYKVLCAKGNVKKIKLNKEHCDIFACYVAPARTWYLIPVENIDSVSVYLSPKNEYSNAMYEMWKEAWNVFM